MQSYFKNDTQLVVQFIYLNFFKVTFSAIKCWWLTIWYLEISRLLQDNQYQQKSFPECSLFSRYLYQNWFILEPISTGYCFSVSCLNIKAFTGLTARCTSLSPLLWYTVFLVYNIKRIIARIAGASTLELHINQTFSAHVFHVPELPKMSFRKMHFLQMYVYFYVKWNCPIFRLKSICLNDWNIMNPISVAHLTSDWKFPK